MASSQIPTSDISPTASQSTINNTIHALSRHLLEDTHDTHSHTHAHSHHHRHHHHHSNDHHSIDTSNYTPQSTPAFAAHNQTQAAGGDIDDRRRPEETDSGRLVQMATALAPNAVTPFLQDHIPNLYAPVGKPDFVIPNHPHTHINTGKGNSSTNQDPNSKFCYRHAPDSKCRRAADENKMACIQDKLDCLPINDQQAITHVWSLFSAAPAKHRELMLQGIITQCCFPQLSCVSREVQEQLKIDFISALPTEIGIKILCYLDTSSLCKAAQVNRRWRELADDNSVWHRMCSQHIDRKCTKCGWGLPLLERKRLRQWAAQSREVVDVTDEVSADPQSDSNKRKRPSSDGEIAQKKTRCERDRLLWKDVYRERFEVGSNWKYGRCNIKVLRGHQNGVTCLGFDDNLLASGSYDGTIRVWDIQTGELKRTLKGHTSGVRTLHFRYPMIISGSLDRSVRVWKLSQEPGQELINSIEAHQEGVITVHSSDTIIASGSIDTTVQVFDLKTRNKLALRGHTDWVNHVRVDDQSRTIFSASDDLTIKMWDIDSGDCLRTFSGHVGQVQQILLMPEDFEPDEMAVDDNASVAGDHRGTTPIPLLDRVQRATIHPDSRTRSHSTPPPEPRQRFGDVFERDPSRPLPPAYMLTAGLDNTVRLWCIASGRCIRTMFGHVEGIWGLAGDTLRVVTGANDSLVKVWEPRSGKCERTFAGHEGPVTCVGLSDSRMASGSEDGTVRLYTFEGSSLAQCGTPC